MNIDLQKILKVLEIIMGKLFSIKSPITQKDEVNTTTVISLDQNKQLFSNEIVQPEEEKITPQTNQFLICPIQGSNVDGEPLTAFSVRISAVIDHLGTAIDPNCSNKWGLRAKDQRVMAFNGEIGDGQSSSGAPFGYMKKVPAQFFSKGEINYVGASCDGIKAAFYLNYDGHGGYDFPYQKMTPILATADGQLRKLSDSEDTIYGQGWDKHHTFSIKHSNGFSSCYRHCMKLTDDVENQINFNANKICTVKQGQVIAYVGDFGFPGSVHLHFEVVNNEGKMVDPYLEKLWIS